MKKARAVLNVARTIPLTTPPMILAAFMCRKLRTVALETADGGTRSLTMAIDAGAPIVSATPNRTASPRRTMNSGVLPRATAPMMTPTTAKATKFAMSIAREPKRSVRTPACGISSRSGIPVTV